MKDAWDEAVICVIGLGYVGMPLARAFARSFRVIGFDTDAHRVNRLNREFSPGTPPAAKAKITFTTDARQIRQANVIIICVPTPVTRSKEPDLSFLREAAATVGRNLPRGSIVIIESTVFPGATEEIVKPILEEESGLKCGIDFRIGYSPERINPGDDEHSIDKVTKVVAGMDDETAEIIARLYGRIAPDVFVAKDIKTAEAAKVIENIQRDLNIALMNELAIIFAKMGLNTRDVLTTAATKWNFHLYSPGLVGGHCIPVDPYYLVDKAKELGYHPQVILAGRAINDSMPKYVAEMAIKALNQVGKVIKGARILIMGLTYKEDVDDIRETPAKGIIKELREYGVEILGYDPLLTDIEGNFGIKMVTALGEVTVDGAIVTVAHHVFREITLDELKAAMRDRPVLIDVRGLFNGEEAEAKGFCYRTL